jgi:hypothetical protein
MLRSVHSVGIDVGDQDRATQGFTETLGFALVQDTPMDPDPGSPRWTDVAPTDRNALLVLVTADEQRDRIGTFSNVRNGEETGNANTTMGIRKRSIAFSSETGTRCCGSDGLPAQINSDGRRAPIFCETTPSSGSAALAPHMLSPPMPAEMREHGAAADVVVLARTTDHDVASCTAVRTADRAGTSHGHVRRLLSKPRRCVRRCSDALSPLSAGWRSHHPDATRRGRGRPRRDRGGTDRVPRWAWSRTSRMTMRPL